MAIIKLRRNPSNVWDELNPILEAGEQGFETDTGHYRIGNGVSRWRELDSFIPKEAVLALINEALANHGGGDGGEVITVDLADHINDPTPHPAYDLGASFLLLYQNAKV